MKKCFKSVYMFLMVVIMSPIFATSFLWHYFVVPGWEIGKKMSDDADDAFRD